MGSRPCSAPDPSVQTEDHPAIERAVRQFVQAAGGFEAGSCRPATSAGSRLRRGLRSEPACCAGSPESSRRMGRLVLLWGSRRTRCSVRPPRGGRVVDEYLSVPEHYGRCPSRRRDRSLGEPDGARPADRRRPGRVRRVARAPRRRPALPPPQELWQSSRSAFRGPRSPAMVGARGPGANPGRPTMVSSPRRAHRRRVAEEAISKPGSSAPRWRPCNLGSSIDGWGRAPPRRLEGRAVLVGASMGGYAALDVRRARTVWPGGARERPGTDDAERRRGRDATIEHIGGRKSALGGHGVPALLARCAGAAIEAARRMFLLSREELVERWR